MKNIYLAIAIVVVVVLIFLANFALKRTAPDVVGGPTATSTVVSTTTVVVPAGSTTTIVVKPNPNTNPTPNTTPNYQGQNGFMTSLNKKTTVQGIAITPLQVTEDSRCPSDVQCAWAGKVAVNVRVNSTVHSFIEGAIVKVGGYIVQLKQVVPYPVSTQKITAGQYRFIFTVTKDAVTTGSCYIGGCSSQICSDQPDMASTCEYREVYSCYKGATCTRQSNGQCGWTQTASLSSCVQAKSAL